MPCYYENNLRKIVFCFSTNQKHQKFIASTGRLTCIIEGRFEHNQCNVMMILADGVVRVNDNMTDQMVGGRRSTEAGQCTIGVDRNIVFADSN